MKDYYELLEVSRKASSDTIKKVFRMMIKKNHPDLFEGEEKQRAEEKVKELNEAYEILINDESRKKYDLELEEYSSQDKEAIQILMEENEYLKNVINEKDRLIKEFLEDVGVDTSTFNRNNLNEESNDYYDSNEIESNVNSNYYPFNTQDRIKKILYMTGMIIVGMIVLWVFTGINLFKILFNIFRT